MTNPKYSTTTTTLKKSWKNCDHIPRRRRRHFNKMSLMLLIFFGCCSTLILWPLNVQAKDLNTASAKGENMLGNDHQQQQQHSHQLQGNALLEGEGNVNVDKTNDNGTFKRLQPSEKTEEDDEEDRSSEVIEMIQPPHTLRHQEHYKQRILQDFKHEREFEHQQKDDDDADKEDVAEEVEEEEEVHEEVVEVMVPQHNRHLKYQQNQIDLQEPITPPTLAQQQHHRRHELHFETQKEFQWPKHHLRHQHHQNPELLHKPAELRHQRPDIRKQNLTTTTVKPLIHRRYFDRASLYQKPLTWTATTEGPHMRHKGNTQHMKSMAFNPHNRLYNDDKMMAMNTNNNNNNNHEEEIKRFSLLRKENENQYAGNPLQDQDNDNNDESVEDTETDYDLEDDYSYEDDENKKPSKYLAASSYSKNTVKRYTNPIRSLYKPSTSSSPGFSKQAGGGSGSLHIRHSLHHNFNANDYEYDESLNDDDKFSDEKRTKKEHEHYLKQMQHQRAMQALRSQRPALDNSANINRLSTFSATSSSSSSSPSQNTGSTKRQVINDDDTENIYSRNYVHGTVTRKKEEELGSPSAIVEARRQYALQQRQNKALASAHHRRIMTEGSCRLPQPRVERIHKDSWKIYTPHCTILHRCADDTGCCPSERQTCAPKRTKNVDLSFFVISLNESQGTIEKLTFVNHTECHCVDKTKQRAPEYGDNRALDLMTNQISFPRRSPGLNCNCPKLFEKILQEDDYCRCDCSSGNLGCDWLKRGMEHFSMYDRKCIAEERCKLPTCEYGQYIKKHGRCPRRDERHLSADGDW